MMSGVAIARALLSDDYDISQEVTVISGGVLPINTVLPAISIRQISGYEFDTINRIGTQNITERVQVTVLARNYVEQKNIIELIRNAMIQKRGYVNGFLVENIRQDLDGPDLYTESPEVYEQSIDYIVRFNR